MLLKNVKNHRKEVHHDNPCDCRFPCTTSAHNFMQFSHARGLFRVVRGKQTQEVLLKAEKRKNVKTPREKKQFLKLHPRR